MKNEFLSHAALLLVSSLPARADMAPDPVTGGIDRQSPDSWHDEFTERDDRRIKQLIARCSKQSLS